MRSVTCHFQGRNKKRQIAAVCIPMNRATYPDDGICRRTCCTASLGRDLTRGSTMTTRDLYHVLVHDWMDVLDGGESGSVELLYIKSNYFNMSKRWKRTKRQGAYQGQSPDVKLQIHPQYMSWLKTSMPWPPRYDLWIIQSQEY
jgi:hypothetical protein